jgi:hypothetical protein
MVKRPCLWAILFAFIFCASGCVTVYTDGCCPNNAAKSGVSKGGGKGDKILEAVKETDDWVKRNIW